MGADGYLATGPFTSLSPAQAERVRAIGSPADPLALCRAAQNLFVAPGVTSTPEQVAERNTRPVTVLLDFALSLDDAPLDQPRAPEARVVGTCRHYAVAAAAFLKAAGIPARARCGFATCFVAGKGVDHWITEWWSASGGDGRWVRTDPEWLGASPGGARTEDLRPGEFLTAGEAWQRVRQGADDGANYGVVGTENWGPGEIRGNAMRDLAALEHVEVLPWDEWGPMHDSYEGRTGDDFDRLVDEMAVACQREDDDAAGVAERQRLLAALGPMAFG